MGFWMLWRAPWMQARLALASLVLWDLIVIFTSYNVIYSRRLGAWPGLTLGLLVMGLVWLGSSYLLGRYSARSSSGLLGQKLLSLGFVVFVVLGVFVFHSWFFVVTDAGTRFRGFLVPLLTMVSSLSLAGQLIVLRPRRRILKWILVVTDKERSLLEQELLNGPVNTDLIPRLFNAAEVETFLESGQHERPWSEITIAISDHSHLCDVAVERLLSLRGQGMQIRALIDWCEIALQRVPPELIDQRWFIATEGFSIQPGRFGWRLKRLIDVIGALLLIVLTAPLMVLVILLIRLDDGGSIFYTQFRSGIYGEIIRIWKFRSMREDAESEGAQWSSRDDSRVTRVGSVMRRFRVDELPQLFGVLAGELSLIGPRPERPELEIDLETLIPHYRIRHWIRPGLSGWAQVNFPYGASAEDARMKLSFDLFYIRNAGVLLDGLIILKTIRLLLSAKGAEPQT